MKSDMPLDYALFQLSPKHSRCELVVSSGRNVEKLASGLVKPFATHLRVIEEQVGASVHSIKLEVERQKNAEMWFTKGTLERFVRFVSTPEVLELANTFDAEVAQLESARRIYSQGQGDQHSGAGGAGSSATAAADATKKELLRAIDVRLAAAQQDLTTACGRAAAAGFNPSTVKDLQMFSDHFGAQRLYEACSKFISLCERRPDLIASWKAGGDNWSALRASYGSDMSIDEDPQTPRENKPTRLYDHSSGQGQEQDFRPHLTSQETKTSFLSRESSVEPEETAKQNEQGSEKDKKIEDSPDQAPSISASQPSRRLSVQDRVKLFENKQKESSGNSGSGGVKPAVGKSVEFRRLSSDVSSLASAAAVEKAEKAVLRRWSGISDMSIDFSCERRDPDSPSVSLSKSEDQRDTASSSKEEVDMGRLAISSDKSEEAFVKNRLSFGSTSVDGDRKSQQKLVSSWGEDDSLNNVQANSDRKSSSLSSSMSEDGSSGENQPKFKVFESRNEPMQFTGLQDKGEKHLGSAVYASQPDQVEPSSQKGEVGIKERNTSESLLRTPKRSVLDGGSGSRNRESFTSRYGGAEGDTSSSKSRGETYVQTKDIGKKELASGSEKVKIERQVRNVGNSSFGKASFSSRSAADHQDGFATPPPEHAQKSRQTKGNQELNDELKLKANELEKLFAEHKLRVPGEQSNPTRRSKPVERKNEPPSKPSADIAVHLDDDSPKNTSKLEDAGDVLDWNSPDLNASGGSRGKFYQSYMQKRDAKLMEEWSSKKEEKEAKLKEMQDNLERSRAEMKARFSGSADRQDSLSKTRQRAERLRSFNTRSILRREQQQLDFEQSDEEDGTEFSEQKYFAEDGPLNGTSAVDGSSKIAQIKKTVPTKSFTPRTAAAPIKSASRPAINSGRRKLQSENHLAQSVPNFSELRKENAKPSSAASKPTRPQVRNFNRSKSTAEESPFTKEEKSRRMLPVRKSSANPVEFKEASTLNSEVASLKTADFDKDGVEQSPYDKRSKTQNKKPSRKKASLDFGARATESTINEFEYDGSVFEAENSMVLVQDEEDEFETLVANGEPEVDNESEKVSFGSEYVVVRSSPDSSLVAEMPALAPSALHPSGNVHDSPGESPVSWNSRSLHPFNYTHELSDIDASVDSPIGSPASWNSHSLSQTENDAARMRKKWGAAQKPMLVGNSSHKQSHKDMTSGFKRLLKFGRKSRGTESLADWISATTSEGDDDTEDGRDPANRSSDDLRKSRMGSLQGHPSDDSFNDSEFFNEQVHSLRSSIPAPPANFKLREEHLSGSSIKGPRSFFSLSTFRSKGSESKPR